MMRDARSVESSPLGEPLVDADDVALYLAIDKTTVYRFARSGTLPSVEIAPRVLRFRPEDVRGFLEQRTRHAAPTGRAARLLGTRA